MRSSIFCAPALPVVASAIPDTPDVPLPGYVVVGHVPAGVPDPEDVDRVILHAAQGVPAPPDLLETIVDGAAGEWEPATIMAAYPAEAPYVLEATWEEEGLDPFGNPATVVRRGKLVDVPVGVEPLQTNLLPHLFAGEQP